MGPLEQSDPREIGPYTAVARLRETASAVRYLARDARGNPAVLTVPRPELASLPAFRRRFQAEARTAERLAGGWVPAPLASRPEWTAYPYTPSVPLDRAVALAGPLPERAVRILGAGLAEILSRLHATGAVLHGLTPQTVELAADGPRLTAFGALGAAASAQAGPDGQLSVRLGYLTPEQVAGERPGTASDLFVLGLLLAHAATGTAPLGDEASIAHDEPELASVPKGLRPLVARCLSKDPAARPSAGTAAADLALEGAAALARDGWLPEPVLKELAREEAQARAALAAVAAVAGGGAAPGARGPQGVADAPATPLPPAPVAAAALPPAALPAARAEAAPSDAPLPVVASTDAGMGAGAGASTGTITPPGPDRATTQFGTGPAGPTGADDHRTTRLARIKSALSGGDRTTTQLVLPPEEPRRPAPPVTSVALPALPPGPSPAPAPATKSPALDRRSLLVGGGVALLVGGVLGFALAPDGDAPAPKAAPKAPAPKPVAGLAPAPSWVYRHPGPAAAALVGDRLLVLTDSSGTSGVDLGSGRRTWAQRDAASAYAALPAGDGSVFVVGEREFLWLSPAGGKVVRRAPNPGVTGVAGQAGPVVWCSAPGVLIAYDTARGKELWRAAVPRGTYELVAVRAADVVLRQDAGTLAPAQVAAAKGRGVFQAFDRSSGKVLWTRQFGTVSPTAPAAGDAEGRLYAAAGGDLYAFATTTAAQTWRQPSSTTAPFGRPLVAGPALYALHGGQTLYAVESAGGALRWKRTTEAPPAPTGAPAASLALAPGGATLFVADTTQVTAFGAADGKRLWKFQDAGVRDAGRAETAPEPYRVLATKATAVVGRGAAYYALPLG
ncbi:PQQ-binding-like beta-propeller repeat protein [Streptomyces sp. NPDC001941]|uniref:outer membrane protein assembly factor BamB family protein n=1 Tax=Streptomyces sp. NPDC001941 TaxID=3154659 RepID=UPI0033333069